ncbi:MAG: hypothetical protein NVS9B12_01570 [Vulcanimicrobiaceae bacterium]
MMLLRRLIAGAALVAALSAAAPAPPLQSLDSQVVVNRYMAALMNIEQPKNVVFSYNVSQAGAHNLEQTHRVFRSGNRQRDETLSIDGDPIKTTRVVSRTDRYSVANIGPRLGSYVFLFLGTHRHGKHLDYVYSTAPIGAPQFLVTEVTIDGLVYLPALVRFKMNAGALRATGAIAYARFSKYWMPTLATVSASVGKKPTRERIAWSAYSFPAALPPSTFFQPKPLAIPTIAPF